MEKRATRKPAAPRRAASDEIVGADFSKQVPERWRKYYDRLIQMRDYLRTGKHDQLRAAEEQNVNYSQHMADAGTSSFEKDIALSLASSEQDALFEIDAALDRIQDGTFGICEMTGKPIEPARLDAIPWTRFSADAERELEAKGEIEHTHVTQPEKIGRTSSMESIGDEWDRETEPAKDRDDSDND